MNILHIPWITLRITKMSSKPIRILVIRWHLYLTLLTFSASELRFNLFNLIWIHWSVPAKLYLLYLIRFKYHSKDEIQLITVVCIVWRFSPLWCLIWAYFLLFLVFLGKQNGWRFKGSLQLKSSSWAGKLPLRWFFLFPLMY